MGVRVAAATGRGKAHKRHRTASPPEPAEGPAETCVGAGPPEPGERAFLVFKGGGHLLPQPQKTNTAMNTIPHRRAFAHADPAADMPSSSRLLSLFKRHLLTEALTPVEAAGHPLALTMFQRFLLTDHRVK